MRVGPALLCSRNGTAFVARLVPARLGFVPRKVGAGHVPSRRVAKTAQLKETAWDMLVPSRSAPGGGRPEATMRTAPRGGAHLLCSLPASQRLPASLLLSPRSLPAWEEAPAYGPLRTGSGAEPDDRPCAAVLSLRVTLHDTCT